VLVKPGRGSHPVKLLAVGYWLLACSFHLKANAQDETEVRSPGTKAKSQ
jgi:hypothetical protein